MGNRLKDKFAAGEVAFGIWAEVPEADLVELCGHLGFEYVMFDAEGTAFDYRAASLLFRACEVADMVPIVRIPEIRASTIQAYLNLGAKGIYVPHVTTADEARAVVDAVRFPPSGHRGAGGFRWARFGVDGDMEARYRSANDEILVIALVEDPIGVENIDDIIRVDGIDVLGVGAGDLSLAMGYPSGQERPQVRSLVVESEARALAAGKVFDAVVGSVEEARDSIERGALMVSYVLRSMVANSGTAFLTELAAVKSAAAVSEQWTSPNRQQLDPEEGVVQ